MTIMMVMALMIIMMMIMITICRILNMKNKFIFVFISYLIGAIWSKNENVVNCWRFRKKIKKKFGGGGGGQVVYNRVFETNCLNIMFLANQASGVFN